MHYTAILHYTANCILALYAVLNTNCALFYTLIHFTVDFTMQHYLRCTIYFTHSTVSLSVQKHPVTHNYDSLMAI